MTSWYSALLLEIQHVRRLTGEGLPDLLTVEEAALLLRIGRNKAYALTREWRATGGRSGIPVVEFGHTLRVPRHALEELLGVKFTAWPEAGSDADALDARDDDLAEPVTRDPMAAPGGSNVTPIRRRRPEGESGQLALFESRPPSPTERP